MIHMGTWQCIPFYTAVKYKSLLYIYQHIFEQSQKNIYTVGLRTFENNSVPFALSLSSSSVVLLMGGVVLLLLIIVT